MKEEDDNTLQSTKGRAWLTPERCLLATIVILQVAILVMLAVRHFNSGDPSGTQTTGKVASGMLTPWEHARSMMADLDVLFESAVTEFERTDAFFDLAEGWNTVMTSPAMDMREREDQYIVVFSLPTPRPSDLQVLLDGRVVTILTVFDTPVLVQRYGEPLRLEKRVLLPGPIGDATLAAANVTNGLLRVAVPKGTGYTADTVYRRLM